MAASDKNYTIKLEFLSKGFDEANGKFKSLSELVEIAGANVVGFSDKVDVASETVKRSVKVQADSFGELQNAMKQLEQVNEAVFENMVKTEKEAFTKREAMRVEEARKEAARQHTLSVGGTIVPDLSKQMEIKPEVFDEEKYRKDFQQTQEIHIGLLEKTNQEEANALRQSVLTAKELLEERKQVYQQYDNWERQNIASRSAMGGAFDKDKREEEKQSEELNKQLQKALIEDYKQAQDKTKGMLNQQVQDLDNNLKKQQVIRQSNNKTLISEQQKVADKELQIKSDLIKKLSTYGEEKDAGRISEAQFNQKIKQSTNAAERQINKLKDQLKSFSDYQKQLEQDDQNSHIALFKKNQEKELTENEKNFNLIERKLAETNARREEIVKEREENLYKIEQAGIKKRMEANKKALAEQDALMSSVGKGQAKISSSYLAPIVEKEITQEEKSKYKLSSGLQGGKRDLEEEKARLKVFSEAVKASNQERLAQLDRDIALEKSKIVNGEKDKKTIWLAAANEEIRIKQKLRSDLKALEESVAAGGSIQQAAIEKTRLLNQATKDLQTTIKDLPKDNAHLTNSFTNMLKHIGEVYFMWGALNAVSTRFREAIYSIIPVGIAFDSVKATLESTVGTASKVEGVLQALNKEANRTGINIGTVRESFSQFQASTSLVGVSLDDTWKMFTQLNTVITGLHKTTDEANHIFLAMTQIFNKNKVQSEELVKQLGNLLPGAFAAFATATNRTTEKLIKDMKAGSVEAKADMEKFIGFMAERFGASFALSSQMLNADLNRMKTAFRLLGEEIYNTEQGPIQAVVKGITSFTNYLTEAIKGTNNFLKVVQELATAAFSLLIASLIAATANMKIFQAETIMVGLKMETLAVKTKLWAASLNFLKSNWIILAITALTDVLVRHEIQVDRVRDSYDSLMGVVKEYYDQQNAKKLEAAPIEVKVGGSEKIQKFDEKIASLGKTIAEFPKMDANLIDVLRGNAIPLSTAFMEDYKKYVDQSADIEKLNKATVTQRIEMFKTLYTTLKKIREDAYSAEVIQEKDNAFKLVQGRIEAVGKAEDILSDMNESMTLKFGDQLEKLKLKTEDFAETQRTKIIKNLKELGEISADPNATKQQQEAAKKEIESLVKGYSDVSEAAKNYYETKRKELEDKEALKNHKEALQELKIEYKDVERDARNMSLSVEKNLTNLDSALKQGQISIAKYRDEWLRLKLEQNSAKASGFQQNLSKAEAAQDFESAKRFADEIQKLDIETANLEAEANAKKTQLLEEYNQKLQEVHAEYLANIGEEEQAAYEQYQLKNALLQKQAEEEAKSGDPKSAKLLEEIRQNAAFARDKVEISKINKNIDAEQVALKEREYALDLDLKSGIIDQLTFQQKLFEERQATIKLIDEQLEKEGKLTLNASQKLQLERQRRENLKANTDKIGASQSILNRGGENNILGTPIKQFMTDNANIEGEKQQQQAQMDQQFRLDAVGKTAKQQEGMYADLLSKKAAMDDKYTGATVKTYTDMFSGIFSAGADTFQSLTDMNVKMYGAGSKEAKKSFAMWKSMKKAEIIASTASGAINAYSAMAGIYAVGPALGVIAAAAVAAFGAMQLAQVESQQLPAAHGGLNYVPEERTYLLNKGERVLSPKQNTDLTSYLNNKNTGAANDPSTVQNNIKIINAVDPNVTLDHMNTPEGERVIMNIIRKNRAA